MSNWLTISADQMAAILPKAQLTALLASYNEGGIDRFGLISSAVIADIRSAVATHGRSISATPLSVPPEAHIRAMFLILEALQPSLPTLMLEKDQIAAVKAAHDWLQMIRENEKIAATVTQPTDPISASGEVQTSAAAMTIGTTVERQFTRAKTDGL